jgi:hypothetical protein
MDHRLPDGYGIEGIRQIRKYGRKIHSNIISHF